MVQIRTSVRLLLSARRPAMRAATDAKPLSIKVVKAKAEALSATRLKKIAGNRK
jgi:hypothetical protein